MWTGNVRGFIGFVTTIIPPTAGTVTSVGLSMPSIFTVSGSPVVSSGTLTATLNDQAANAIFAGPSSGPVAAPTFRSLVDADLPHTNLTMMYYAANQGIDSDAPSGVNTLNIGTGNANIINIGWSGATVNVQGTTFYQNVTNLQVTDKLFTVNKGGSAGSGNSAGFEIEEGGVATGLFATNGTRDGWDFKAPAITGIATLSLAGLTANRTLTVQDASGTIAYLSDISANAWALGGNTNAGLQYIGTNNAFDFPIYTNGAEVANFTTSGRLGLGTSTPSEKFEIYDITAPFALKAFINNSLSSGYAELMMFTDIADMRFGCGGSAATPYGGNPGDCYFGAVSYSALILATNNTVRARIDQDGLVGIGTFTNPINGQFEVLNSGITGFAIYVTGGAGQGIYATSDSIAVNGAAGTGGIGVAAQNTGTSGTSLYVRSYNAATILADFVGSSTATVAKIIDDGSAVFGSTAPNARIHSVGRQANNVNARFEPVAGVYEDTLGETVNTTDGTTTTIQTIPIPADTGLLIQAFITCRKTGGTGTGTTGDVNSYIRTVKAKNVGGVVTIGTIETTFTSEDIAVFNATFDVSGTDVRVRISGSTNNNVTWKVISNTYPT